MHLSQITVRNSRHNNATFDALGNSALFEYDSIGNLVKTSLHRVDTQDNVDEWEVTLYEFDGRGLTTKQVDALGNVTTYAYDGNGNLVSKTDPDGYTTEYTYNALDLVNGIDLHVSYSYDRSHKSNTMYWTTPSTWSQGCLTVNISDYIQFGAATGFLNGNSYDYYADYGLSNKENWDYTTFKANFKYETYGTLCAVLQIAASIKYKSIFHFVIAIGFLLFAFIKMKGQDSHEDK